MEINIPLDPGLEGIILGCIIQSSKAADYCMAYLDDTDFMEAKHKVIFSSIKALYLAGKEINLENLSFHLQSEGKFDAVGKIAGLTTIAFAGWSGAPYEDFLARLKNLTMLRKIVYASKEALYRAGDKTSDGREVIQTLETKLYEAQGVAKNTTRTLQEVLENFSPVGNFIDDLKYKMHRRSMGFPPYDGIASGYKTLDETLGNFRPSCIYYIGARTSMGKTTFMLNLVKNMLSKKIGIFSLEMPAPIITAKLLCLLADVRFSWYEDQNLVNEQVERLFETGKILMNTSIYVEDPDSIDIMHLRAKAKRMQRVYGIEILFIDYLTRIKAVGNHSNKHLSVDEISKTLQSLAKELNIPIICLAQLSRAAANREDPRPTLVDFRESGSIEEDADACILLHRPEYYDPHNKPGMIEVIVAKNRLRGIIKNISFTCNSKLSEVYHESRPINEELGEQFKQFTP